MPTQPITTAPLTGPVIAVAVAALLWGLWWLPLRSLETAGLSGDWVSVAVYGIGGLLLLPFVLPHLRGLRTGGWPLWGAGLIFGLALAAWNHALLTGEVIRVSLLFYLAPVWGTVLAAAFLNERATLLRAAAVATGVAGAAVLLGPSGGLPLPRNGGEWMSLAAGLLFAVAATCAARQRPGASGEWLLRSWLAMLVAALAALALATPTPAPALAGDGAGIGFAIAVLLAAIWQLLCVLPVLWGAGLLGPARVSFLLLLEIIAATVSAALWAGEPFGWPEIVGGALILACGLLEAVDHQRRGGQAIL